MVVLLVWIAIIYAFTSTVKIKPYLGIKVHEHVFHLPAVSQLLWLLMWSIIHIIKAMAGYDVQRICVGLMSDALLKDISVVWQRPVCLGGRKLGRTKWELGTICRWLPDLLINGHVGYHKSWPFQPLNHFLQWNFGTHLWCKCSHKWLNIVTKVASFIKTRNLFLHTT